MNILLVCAAGMSTSLLVIKMKQAALNRGIKLNIQAMPINEIKNYKDPITVILLGPQVRHQIKQVNALYPDVPAQVIDMRDYGMMNGENVLDDALRLAERTGRI